MHLLTPRPSTGLSPALYYMQASGLHSRTASYYHSPTDPQTFESGVLYSQAARYLQTYYTLHAEHAMAKLPHLLNRTLARISMVLNNTAPSDLALRPPNDLKLLVALPRAALLLQQQHRFGRSFWKESVPFGFLQISELVWLQCFVLKKIAAQRLPATGSGDADSEFANRLSSRVPSTSVYFRFSRCV